MKDNNKKERKRVQNTKRARKDRKREVKETKRADKSERERPVRRNHSPFSPHLGL